MPRKVKVKNTNKNTNINKISIHLSEIKKRRRAKRNAKIQSTKQQQPIQQPVQFYQQPLKMSIPVQMPIVRGVHHQTTPIIDALSVPQNQYKTTQMPGVPNVEFLDEQRKQLEQHKKDTEDKLSEYDKKLENFNFQTNYLENRDNDTRMFLNSFYSGVSNKFKEHSYDINNLYNVSNAHTGNINTLNSNIIKHDDNIDTLNNSIDKIRNEGQGATIHILKKIDNINDNMSSLASSNNPLINSNPVIYSSVPDFQPKTEYTPNKLIEKINPLQITNEDLNNELPFTGDNIQSSEELQTNDEHQTNTELPTNTELMSNDNKEELDTELPSQINFENVDETKTEIKQTRSMGARNQGVKPAYTIKTDNFDDSIKNYKNIDNYNISEENEEKIKKDEERVKNFIISYIINNKAVKGKQPEEKNILAKKYYKNNFNDISKLYLEYKDYEYYKSSKKRGKTPFTQENIKEMEDLLSGNIKKFTDKYTIEHTENDIIEFMVEKDKPKNNEKKEELKKAKKKLYEKNKSLYIHEYYDYKFKHKEFKK